VSDNICTVRVATYTKQLVVKLLESFGHEVQVIHEMERKRGCDTNSS